MPDWDRLYHSMGVQRIIDNINPARWRFNPVNLIASRENNRVQGELGTNYHTGERHSALYSLQDAAKRLEADQETQGRMQRAQQLAYAAAQRVHPGQPGHPRRLQVPAQMPNLVRPGHIIPQSNVQGRFNSASWEKFCWRKARQQFEQDMQGHPVIWRGYLAGGRARNAQPHLSSWNIVEDLETKFWGSSVGTTIQYAGQNADRHLDVRSTNLVRVAVNYSTDYRSDPEIRGGAANPHPAGTIWASNGQMFPVPAANVAAGAVAAQDPVGASNGHVIPIPYELF